MNNDVLVDAARDSLGPFCSSTCKAKCCKKGYLPVSAQESLLFETDLYDKTQSRVTLTPGCSHLKKDSCTIYARRPKACREFPVYLKGKTILIASWCEGYKAGKLDTYLKKFEEEGLKVIIV